MFRTLGAQRGMAFALWLTGHEMRLQRDLERAAGLYRESLALFGEVGEELASRHSQQSPRVVAQDLVARTFRQPRWNGLLRFVLGEMPVRIISREHQ